MNAIEQLINDYKRRLEAVSEMLETNKSNGSINDIKREERLITKANEYRTFIVELEKALRDGEKTPVTQEKHKTHIVIDTVYHEDEGNDVYAGTQQECHEWAAKQGFGYKVVPMTPEELKIYNS